MIWDWGFTWQDITITSCYIAINCKNFGGGTLASGRYQGTGSISVVDSTFNAVPYGILTNPGGPSPNIVLDNLYVTNPYNTPANIVKQDDGSASYLSCPANGNIAVQSWGMGLRYTSLLDQPTNTTGYITPAPSKAAGLLNNGKYFVQSKPQYQSTSAGSFIVVTDHGVKNDGTGDQTSAINSVLSGAGSNVVFFPSGIYAVQGTVMVPPGTMIVGELWPQIMATGSYFQDEKNPKVMVQVGQPGQTGVVQISDMLFTVQGATAGCILMEWNIHESSQGSAGMWDSHFRVGGTNGSSLGLADCPAGNMKSSCKAASMLLHVTSKASGYFENVWAWVADHDLDSPLNGNNGDDQNGVPLAANVQVAVYGARGILIESQGPTWFYGTAAEHSTLYQYQLQGASNIYLGTMQTETPYYQPDPNAFSPFTIGTFPSDPTFDTCVLNSSCADAWAFRIQNSTNVYVYSAGFYSFFQTFDTFCNPLEDCQEKLIDTSYSQGLWIYNIFTKGAVQILSPEGLPPIFQNDSNQVEYTSEISAWLPLANTGKDIGGESGDGLTVGNVSILPLPCTTVPPLSTFTMSAACTSGIIVLPTSGPNASVQNTPSGEPPVCNEVCDFFRMLSGTCCGRNGTLGSPIVIPPNVFIPWDIVLPSGYVPNVNITIPVPGEYSPTSLYYSTSTTTFTTTFTATITTTDSSGKSTTVKSTYTNTETTAVSNTNTGSTTYTTTGTTTITTGGSTVTTPYTSVVTGTGGGGGTSHPCGVIPLGTPITVFGVGVPLPSAITLPAGFCDPLPTPIVIPPLPLPNDPPCFPPRICGPCQAGPCPPGIVGPQGSSDAEPCGNDPAPDAETGRCSNGNFPVWDAETGQIDCDIPDAMVPEAITDCQMEADQNYNDTLNSIECFLSECDAGTGGFKKRAVPQECNPPPSYMPGPPSGSQLTCDATFLCDTDEWPNVCNNARSAMVPQAQGGRGAPQVLTYYGEDYHLTARYIDLHGYVRAKGRDEGPSADLKRANNVFQPIGGWGLIGCQVEEYPFGNSHAANPGAIARFNDRPTLRLIPQSENAKHGSALGQFIRYTQNYGHSSPGVKTNVVYCVEITGNTQPSDYCINSGATCNNKCAAAYGPAFILVNEVTLADQQAAEAAGFPNEQRWDRWFDQAPGRKYDHTLSFVTQNGMTYTITTTLPPQFATTTAPCNDMTPNNWPIIAPGQKIYTGKFPNGAWVNQYTIPQGFPNAGQNRIVGIPRNAARVPPADGTNYRFDAVPQNGFPSKRDLGDAVEMNMTDIAEEDTNPAHWVQPPANLSLQSISIPKQLTPRQALGGSWLDPAVFSEVLSCQVDIPEEFGGNVYGTFPPQSVVTSTGTGGTTSPTSKPTSGGTTTPPPTTGLASCQPATLSSVTYCSCPSASWYYGTLASTGTGECAYSYPLPTPKVSGSPFCVHGADPHATVSSAQNYCNCDGYPSTLPTLTSPSAQCGYTTLPPVPPVTVTNNCIASTYNINGNYESTATSSVAGCSPTASTTPGAPGCISFSGSINVPLIGQSRGVIHNLSDGNTQFCDDNVETLGTFRDGNGYVIQCRVGYNVTLDAEALSLGYNTPYGSKQFKVGQYDRSGGFYTCSQGGANGQIAFQCSHWTFSTSSCIN